MTSAVPCVIESVGAITPLGDNWASTWNELLAGTTISSPASVFGIALAPDIEVAGISSLDRSIDSSGKGPAARLMDTAAEQILRPGNSLAGPIWAATNHGEADSIVRTGTEDISILPEINTDAFTDLTWVASACTSGLHALYFAWLALREGDGDQSVVAGDSLSSSGIAGFYRAGATGQGHPCPFDSGSQGMLVSEGAVAVRLSAIGPGDGPKLLAMALSSDAGHPTSPDPLGRYLEDAMRRALNLAGLECGQIGAIVAHGTGTQANDMAEAGAISRIWQGAPVPVTSAKGNLGHIMGSAGLLNIAIAAQIWREGLVPGIPGLELARRGLAVSREPAVIGLRQAVLVLASGFGGNNVAAVVG